RKAPSNSRICATTPVFRAGSPRFGGDALIAMLGDRSRLDRARHQCPWVPVIHQYELLLPSSGPLALGSAHHDASFAFVFESSRFGSSADRDHVFDLAGTAPDAAVLRRAGGGAGFSPRSARTALTMARNCASSGESSSLRRFITIGERTPSSASG